MRELVRSTAFRLVYWGVVAAGMLFLVMVGISVRNRHQLDGLILEAAENHGLHPALVAAVVWRESRFDPAAVGKKGEIGLMQITGAAATDWARSQGLPSLSMDTLWHPQTNLTVGAWYLERAKRFWADQGCRDPLPFALAEYNAGRTNAKVWAKLSGTDAEQFIEAIAFPSTQDYVVDVLRRYRRRTP